MCHALHFFRIPAATRCEVRRDCKAEVIGLLVAFSLKSPLPTMMKRTTTVQEVMRWISRTRDEVFDGKVLCVHGQEWSVR
ncbi:hypothetical protein HBI56_114520 [Parastagonospora nodorum]|uniref:Uncharacterized protein n=1 Tax=Phaeosphaeria nodorum (strain SN15 / ATCC MYA-4574 / FGSC 10173) TaxID=321614 RepID=A0A7U2FCP3_PHANO|nr:hypothetical protein HBH56_195370 [Parastagonospora nodorum]QRD00536.1 hypothetical protein JI435_090920 [Parastagonospora nodorum SN15]KAH3924979.1 hypothetical protein HBH54_188120 [Parastagonospora nodorum]KAH3953339.1 hypothetical protein HBH53_040270 [Parastagonospora nodorum]KAH3976583.1 hypothetical protein HBH52_118220 [Parastagonospora nodorum]